MIAMAGEVASLKEDVEDLYARYVELIGDDRLEELPDLFVENCLYKVISRENFDRKMPVAAIFCDSRNMLIDRIVSLRHANIYPDHHTRHLVSNIRIAAMEASIIHTRASYAVFHTRNDGHSFVYNVGRYVDEIVREEGQLKFKSKLAIFDTHMIETVMVKPI